MPQRFTSWEAIYKTLLAAFPAESYHLGAEMAGFNQASNSSSVSVRLATGGRRKPTSSSAPTGGARPLGGTFCRTPSLATPATSLGAER
jgi:hypothetical protein